MGVVQLGGGQQARRGILLLSSATFMGLKRRPSHAFLGEAERKDKGQKGQAAAKEIFI